MRDGDTTFGFLKDHAHELRDGDVVVEHENTCHSRTASDRARTDASYAVAEP